MPYTAKNRKIHNFTNKIKNPLERRLVTDIHRGSEFELILLALDGTIDSIALLKNEREGPTFCFTPQVRTQIFLYCVGCCCWIKLTHTMQTTHMFEHRLALVSVLPSTWLRITCPVLPTNLPCPTPPQGHIQHPLGLWTPAPGAYLLERAHTLCVKRCPGDQCSHTCTHRCTHIYIYIYIYIHIFIYIYTI